LALRGFVVLSLNYRSGIGYGLDFREAPGYGAHGATELNDLIGAGLYLRNRPDVDSERVGLWGASYGGYLTALGLSRAPDLFAAGVDIHGVYDWNIVIRNFEPSYDPLVERATARLASILVARAFGCRKTALPCYHRNHGHDATTDLESATQFPLGSPTKPGCLFHLAGGTTGCRSQTIAGGHYAECRLPG
jgi:hypothetical protein